MPHRRRVRRIGHEGQQAGADEAHRRDREADPADAETSQATQSKGADNPDQASERDTGDHRRGQQSCRRLK